MTAVARDEVDHLAIVTRLLARRGGKLTKSHANPCASELYRLVRKGRKSEELADRLMISSLIEARSMSASICWAKRLKTITSCASSIEIYGRRSTGIICRSFNWLSRCCQRVR
jgi:hypothetical protein